MKLSKSLTLSLGLVALTLLVFGKTVGYDYVIYDDRINVYDNAQIPPEEPLSEVSKFWKAPYQGFYIPLTYSFWAGIAALSELKIYPETGTGPVFDASLFHLANIVLHAGSTLLVFFLIYRIFGKKDLLAAAVGAAVFAVHPMQAEAVSWVTGLKDVLSTFLALLCTAAYLLHAERLRDKKEGVFGRWYWIAATLFVVALLSKPHFVALPILFLWFEHLIAKTGLKSLALKMAPFALAGLVFAVVTVHAQMEPDTIVGAPVAEKSPLWQRGVLALDALTFYASKTVYPLELGLDYGRRPETVLRVAQVFPVWLLVPALLAVVLLRRKPGALVISGAGVILIGLLPVLGFIQFGFQEQSTVADRYMYLPMFGVAILLAALMGFLHQRRARYAIAGIVPVLAILCWCQVSHWKNAESLFRHALAVNPSSVTAHINLAAFLGRTGDLAGAAAYYESLLKLIPARSHRAGVASHSLGRLRLELGEAEAALEHLARAVELQPSSPEFHADLARALAAAGRQEDARAAAERALRLGERTPGYPPEALTKLREVLRPLFQGIPGR